MELPRLAKHAVRFRRLYVSAAVECELDGSGRVLIPQELRSRAKLDKDAVWAGMGQTLELWSKEQWDRALVMSEAEVEELRSAMEQVKL
jgi:MraZ protein